jgi:hypothetical protein
VVFLSTVKKKFCNVLTYILSGASLLLDSMPLRFASRHQCFANTPVYRVLRAVNTLVMQGAINKMRLQTHLGDDWELRYKLLGYGIPMDCKSMCFELCDGSSFSNTPCCSSSLH